MQHCAAPAGDRKPTGPTRTVTQGDDALALYRPKEQRKFTSAAGKLQLEVNKKKSFKGSQGALICPSYSHCIVALLVLPRTQGLCRAGDLGLGLVLCGVQSLGFRP